MSMRALLQVVLNAVALWLAAKLVPGIHYVGGVEWLLIAGLVLGLLNLLVKPLLTLLSLPLIVLSLGLFYLVINGFVLYLAARLMPHHLQVAGCAPAILGGLVIGLFNWAIRAFAD
jgi:putative membrane protein